MSFLNCPRCGLILAITRPADVVDHCPRCLARRRRLVELFVSDRPRGRRSAAPPRDDSESPDGRAAALAGRTIEQRR
jgi:hypothetical protein